MKSRGVYWLMAPSFVYGKEENSLLDWGWDCGPLYCFSDALPTELPKVYIIVLTTSVTIVMFRTKSQGMFLFTVY
jgi:hypothetical protein